MTAELTNEQLAQIKHEKRLGLRLRPEVVRVMINRELRRRLTRDIRKRARSQGERPATAVVTKGRSDAEAIDRVSLGLYNEFQKNVYPGTVKTLASFLDRYESVILEESYRKGQPLPRHLIRAALERIYREGERRRNHG